MTTHRTEATGEQTLDRENDRAIPETMRAITQDRYGRPEVLSLGTVEVPTPGAGEVLVEVRASSVNIADWHLTTGTPAMVKAVTGLTKPRNPIPGADVAGVVVAVGPTVTDFAVGDEVLGDISSGAWAEYTTAEMGRIVKKPKGVSFEHAAAVPLAAITALQGLRDKGGLGAGQRVLINGASGGVGTFAVQIGKALGAHVTAVCSTGKVDQARAMGADHVIDYTRDDFVASERGYDVLFDNVGNRPWSETRRVLADGGINVTITGPKHGILGPFRNLLFRKVLATASNKRFTWFTAEVKADDLSLLADWLESGTLNPVIERTYQLAQAPDALAYLGEGHAHGKLVISI